MKAGWALLATALLVIVAGCQGSESSMSKKEAEDKIFAPTDVNALSPEARAKIPANGLGPAGSAGASASGPMPGAGATPPPNVGG